jgi:hypothetical protein
MRLEETTGVLFRQIKTKIRGENTCRVIPHEQEVFSGGCAGTQNEALKSGVDLLLTERNEQSLTNSCLHQYLKHVVTPIDEHGIALSPSPNLKTHPHHAGPSIEMSDDAYASSSFSTSLSSTAPFTLSIFANSSPSVFSSCCIISSTAGQESEELGNLKSFENGLKAFTSSRIPAFATFMPVDLYFLVYVL